MLTTVLVCLALAQSKPEPLDAAPFKDKLLVLTDGQKHYIAVDTTDPLKGNVFTSGDGKTFTQVRVVSGGRNGDEAWDISVWDLRVMGLSWGPASVVMKDSGAEYQVLCAKKNTKLTPLKGDEAKKVLEGATFTKPSWTRAVEKLLRDDTGTYYLVDRYRSEDGNDRRDFRVFVGPKGAMKLMPLKEVVDDSQGMVLATKGGNLRLITGAGGKFEGKWVNGKTVLPLVEIDLSLYATGRLIYMDLGPYTGQRLGTFCDDFM